MLKPPVHCFKSRETTVRADIISRAAAMAQFRGSVWCWTTLNKNMHLCKSLWYGWHQEPLPIIMSSGGEMRVHLYNGKELFL